jgi:hypothetical protein
VDVAAESHPGSLIDWLGDERALRMKRRNHKKREDSEQQTHASP